MLTAEWGINPKRSEKVKQFSDTLGLHSDEDFVLLGFDIE
jgi:hypothetical protein